MCNAGAIVDAKLLHEVQQVVLPTLLKLLNCEQCEIQEEAPQVLATLIADNEDLQRRACDVDAISELVHLFKDAKSSDKLKRVCKVFIIVVSFLCFGLTSVLVTTNI